MGTVGIIREGLVHMDLGDPIADADTDALVPDAEGLSRLGHDGEWHPVGVGRPGA
jgi:hypothetical protein